MCNYAAICGYIILNGIVERDQLWSKEFMIGGQQKPIRPTYTLIIKYLLQKHNNFIFVCILGLIMGVTLALFVVYHLSLVARGVTTNEKFRKTDTKNYFTKRINKVMQDI